MKKRNWILYAALAIMLALPALSPLEQSVAAASPAAVDVKIDNFSFLPPTLTDIPHNVVSNDQSFKSRVLDTDEKFTYTVSKPGTYIYYCSIHPKMTGKIVVE